MRVLKEEICVHPVNLRFKTPIELVGVVGLEPTSTAYQAHTGYKPAALPIELHPRLNTERRASYSKVMGFSFHHSEKYRAGPEQSTNNSLEIEARGGMKRSFRKVGRAYPRAVVTNVIG